MSKNKKKCRQYNPSYNQYWFISSKNIPLQPVLFASRNRQTHRWNPPNFFYTSTSFNLIGEKPKEYFEALSESVCYSSSKLKGFLIERKIASGLTTLLLLAHFINRQDVVLDE